jgi:hypothetical protein
MLDRYSAAALRVLHLAVLEAHQRGGASIELVDLAAAAIQTPELRRIAHHPVEDDESEPPHRTTSASRAGGELPIAAGVARLLQDIGEEARRGRAEIGFKDLLAALLRIDDPEVRDVLTAGGFDSGSLLRELSPKDFS